VKQRDATPIYSWQHLELHGGSCPTAEPPCGVQRVRHGRKGLGVEGWGVAWRAVQPIQLALQHALPHCLFLQAMLLAQLLTPQLFCSGSAGLQGCQTVPSLLLGHLRWAEKWAARLCQSHAHNRLPS